MACANGMAWCPGSGGVGPHRCLKCQAVVNSRTPPQQTIKLPMAYGNRLHYGAGVCRNCRNVHGVGQHLIESGASKAYIEIFIANLMITASADWATKNRRFMVGVLVPKGPSHKVLIACSKDGNKNGFEAAARRMGNTIICPDVQRPVVTRGGKRLSEDMVASCRDGNEPLTCAAPKLIDYAIRHGYPTPFDMTEVFIDPRSHAGFFQRDSNTGVLSPTKAFSTHGVSIESCKTCANLVPTMMCTAP
ncbi:hypothetical protein BSY16_934 [Sinorhizobium sp. RAC02]|nr:hypothetical protein BSY16_934 [Sinorhizobium sp. RAC02]